MVESLYKTLGLRTGATLIEIKKAYRSLAKEYHPDKNKEGAEKFKEINNAYSILCDSEKLSEYKRRNQPTATSSSASSGYSAYGFSFPMGSEFFTFFTNEFSSSAYPPPPPRRNAEPQRSASPVGKPPRTCFDIRTDCTLTLEDIYNGSKVNVQYTEEIDCSLCKNNKRQSHLKRFKMCERCEGKGLINRHVDGRKVQKSMKCVFCKGVGKLKYYVECKGCKGVDVKQHSMGVRVPKGIHEGYALQVKDRGYLKPDNTRGKVLIRINIAEHSVFVRQGDNLHITTKITLKEAILGFTDKKLCTHLDGRNVLVTQASGYTIRPNSRRRLKGEGMPIYGSKEKAFGDLIVTFDVEWQDTIQIPPSREIHEALEKVFETDKERKSREDVIVIDDDEEEESAHQNVHQGTTYPNEPPATKKNNTRTSSTEHNVLERMSEDDEDEDEEDQNSPLLNSDPPLDRMSGPFGYDYFEDDGDIPIDPTASF